MFMRRKSESEMQQIWGKSGMGMTPPNCGDNQQLGDREKKNWSSQHGVAEASPPPSPAVGSLVTESGTGSLPRGLRQGASEILKSISDWGCVWGDVLMGHMRPSGILSRSKGTHRYFVTWGCRMGNPGSQSR